MSSWRVPPTTSKGVSCSEVGSMLLTFGTTVALSVSSTRQVSVSPNASPMRTAALSVRHQQLIGPGAARVSGGSVGTCEAIRTSYPVAQIATMTPVRMPRDIGSMNPSAGGYEAMSYAAAVPRRSSPAPSPFPSDPVPRARCPDPHRGRVAGSPPATPQS